ncbi:MAG: hypothetical protein LIO93_11620 [Bacteroidales bacterium]|nr:hypothetical protein [Bacteroidales bacterium]
MKRTLFSLLMVTVVFFSLPVNAQNEKKDNSGAKKENCHTDKKEDSKNNKEAVSSEKKETASSTTKQTKNNTVTCATTKKLIVENKSCGKK